MKLSKLYLLSLSCSVIALTSCSGTSVKDTLCIGRRAPDEFKVVSRPPLSVPPQFNLRPPSTTASSPTAVRADKQAQSIIVGREESDNTFDLSEATTDTAVTPVESENLPKSGAKSTSKTSRSSQSAFMKNIGTDQADPTVRDTLIEQKIEADEKREEAAWWDFTSKKPEKKDPLVNAKGEAERIQKNKAENQPVTEGKTPESKDKDRGLLGDLLGL